MGFHGSGARFRLLAGGRGSGKTAAGSQEALRRIRLGRDGLVLSPSIPHFNTSTRVEFWRWIPWEHVEQHHKTEKWIRFDTGATVWYGGIEDEDRWRGPNVNWLWFDEAARKKADRAWLVAVGGVRVGVRPAAWITTTPRGRGHWLYRLFVEKVIPPEVEAMLAEVGHSGPLYEWFRVTIHENRHNLDPLFYASLLTAYVGQFKRQELDGEFVEGGGTLADRAWFRVVDAEPVGVRWVRFWDLATTGKQLAREGYDPDYAAGARMGRTEEGLYVIAHVARGQWRWMRSKRMIVGTAKGDGRGVEVGVEAVAGFKTAAEELQTHSEMIGYTVRAYGVSRDKVSRANPWLAQAEAGNVVLVRGPWNEAFLDEVAEFPVGDHDDQVDAVSGAVAMLGSGGPAAADYEEPGDYHAEAVRSVWM